MVLKFEVGTNLCYMREFEINGVEAYEDDFGYGYDAEPKDADPYSCGNRVFVHVEPTKEVLEKYKINRREYYQLCDKLEEVLSFGNCGWCS